MIVDVCLYAGETEMLELRMRTLAPVVDLFVVVTCALTHQGEPADPAPLPGGPDVPVPFVYEVQPSLELQRRNGEVWTRPEGERGPALSPWYQHIERQHRNGVVDALDAAGVDDPDAWVMISDVDEIPSIDALHRLAPYMHAWPLTPPGIGSESFIGVVCQQRFHSTALDLLHPHQPWPGTCITRRDALVEGMPQRMRNERPDPTMIKVSLGGWHLSWFGTDDERARKVDTFSHAELRGVYDPALGRRTLTHANGEPLTSLTLNEIVTLDWPAPIVDRTFKVPDHWWST